MGLLLNFKKLFEVINIAQKENKHQPYDLAQMQSLPLSAKILMSQQRIRDWYEHWDGQVYISFSGGKDSTVLLDLVRKIYPDVPAVFCDTGLEYPEVRAFVKTFDNVDWIHPEKYNRKTKIWERYAFPQVIQDVGYPVPSKEQAAFIQEYRDTSSEKLKNIRLNGNSYGRGKISKCWLPLIDAPFNVSDRCCDIMKKHPASRYEKKTGRKPYIGTMAQESAQRLSNWLMYGCNAFEAKRPQSKPLSFWTEQDILQYIVENKLKIASVYGDIVAHEREREREYELTGVTRTGCMFCMFGVHLEKQPNRFQRMKETHPKQYAYCMKPVEEGGLGVAKVLDYINVPYE